MRTIEANLITEGWQRWFAPNSSHGSNCFYRKVLEPLPNGKSLPELLIIATELSSNNYYLDDFKRALEDLVQKERENLHPNSSKAKSESEDVLSQLERLTALYKADGLTEEEFKAAKAKLLGL